MDKRRKKEPHNKIQMGIHAVTLLSLLAIGILAVIGCQNGIFRSVETFQAYIAGLGILAPVIFVLIQAVQVVIPILPGAIGCVAGVLVFGPLYGFIYNYTGICMGSVAAFLIARQYGMRAVQCVVSAKSYQKYIGWLDQGKRFDRLFAAAIFFPVAPDDLLCYLAGLTKIRFEKFTAIILLGKPASIFLYSMGITSFTKCILHFAGNVG